MFRVIGRLGVSKFGIGIPDRRSGGGRYRNYPKSPAVAQHVEPSTIYLPPKETIAAEEPAVAQVTETPTPEDVTAVAEKLQEHFTQSVVEEQQTEPKEVRSTGLTPEEIEEHGFLESYVTEWHPEKQRGILRRYDGTHFAFAAWQIQTVGIETLKKGSRVYHQMDTDRHGAPVAVNVWIESEL